jgi:hypothetical protein
MLEGTGSIDFGPTGGFESMILATSSGILRILGKKLHVVAQTPAITMRPRVQMRAAAAQADITFSMWYAPREDVAIKCGAERSGFRSILNGSFVYRSILSVPRYSMGLKLTTRDHENFGLLILEVADGTAGSLLACLEHWPMSFLSPCDARY